MFQDSELKEAQWIGRASDKAYSMITPAECYDEEKRNSFFVEILYSGHEVPNRILHWVHVLSFI